MVCKAPMLKLINIIIKQVCGQERLFFFVSFSSVHRGPVTGCVYSKACNFLVTVGTDCDGRILARHVSLFSVLNMFPVRKGFFLLWEFGGNL